MAKNTGKVREFCQSGKVGTLVILKVINLLYNWPLAEKTSVKQSMMLEWEKCAKNYNWEGGKSYMAI